MLRFLRQYYRYRKDFAGKMLLQVDQQGEGGIISDGQLSFQLEDGKQYLATFEATSKASEQEIRYLPKEKKLRWDSISVGTTIAMLLYVILYEEAWMSIRTHGLLLNLLVVIGTLFITGILYYFIRRNHRIYRYIFAIEQFKQFQADDQWIAMGEDVFQSPDDPILEELKRQCIYNGFGLVSIDTEEIPTLIIAPARHDEVKKKRSNIQFIDQKKSLGKRSFQAMQSSGAWIMKWFRRMTPKDFLLRFQHIGAFQITSLFLSLLILASLFIRQILDRPFLYPSESQWEKKLENLGNKKEPSITDITSKEHIPMAKREVGYLDILPEDTPPPSDPYLSEIESFLASDSRLFTYYDCSRLYNIEKTKYLIKWQTYGEFHDATDEMVRLMQKGFRMSLVWHGCFESDVEGYIVFLDLLYDTQNEAINRAENLLTRLRKAGERTDQVGVLVLRR